MTGPAAGTTVGEIVLRGNSVMIGSDKDTAATEAAFNGGCFHTGDSGVMHPYGYIRLKERAEDLIISGGEVISTIEVGQAIANHPKIPVVAVIGVPDGKWGKTPVAYAIRVSGPTVYSYALADHARSQPAGFKVPKTIHFLQDRPRTSTGKVQKTCCCKTPHRRVV